MVNLSEQYAEALDNLLARLKMIKASGSMIDGMPTDSLFNFAKSEINSLQQGYKVKDECKNCSDCCIKPPAVVPLEGIDGGVIRPLRYGLKHLRQPCWWLRQDDEGFKCVLFKSNERPFTCVSYTCESRAKLEEIISNSEKGGK